MKRDERKCETAWSGAEADRHRGSHYSAQRGGQRASHANACICNGLFLSMCPVGNVRWHVFFIWNFGFHEFSQEESFECNWKLRRSTMTFLHSIHTYAIWSPWTEHSFSKPSDRIKIKIRFSTNFWDSTLCAFGQLLCNIVATAAFTLCNARICIQLVPCPYPIWILDPSIMNASTYTSCTIEYFARAQEHTSTVPTHYMQ